MRTQYSEVQLQSRDIFPDNFKVQPVVAENCCRARRREIMQSNFGYVGITMFEEEGAGFESEVVRSFAVDGGCVPSLTVRDGSVTLRRKRRGGLQELRSLGFQVGVYTATCSTATPTLLKLL